MLPWSERVTLKQVDTRPLDYNLYLACSWENSVKPEDIKALS
jgi:hypothetical protein